MKDYLNVIITDGEKEWQGQGIAVPGIGHTITVRDESGGEVFGGTVSEVHWGYRAGCLGVVVSVWLS